MMSRDQKLREKAKQNLSKSYREAEFDYDYPYDLDFRPKSKLTEHILSEIDRRCALSASIRADYVPHWQNIDRVLRYYMPADDFDVKRKVKDPRRPVTIVLPMSFNIRETFVANMASVFLRRPEIQRYRGVGTDDALVGAALLERVCSRQSLWFQEARKLMQHWADGFTYGFAASAVSWSKRKARNRVVRQITELEAEWARLQGRKVSPDDRISIPDEFPSVLCEGTELISLDPYQVFLDGKTSIADIHDAEYFGWQYSTSVFDLLRRERDEEEMVFNAKYVRLLAEQGGGESRYWNRSDKRNISGQYSGYYANPNTRDVHVTVMCMDLIPSEWGLADYDYPQKWVFEVVGDIVIVNARPLDFDHGMFPLIASAPNVDAHSIVPMSHLASVAGIQTAGDWLMKSKFDFATTILNGKIFVNPKKVVMEDLLASNQGQLVRVKSSAYDEDRVDRYVHQLQVQDVTQQHVSNILVLQEMAERGMGIGSVAQGDLSDLPERPGQLGIEAAVSGPKARLGLVARMLDEQAMIPLAWQKAFNVMQFMDQDVWVPLVGHQEERLRAYFGLGSTGGGPDIQVTRDMLNVAFDVIPSSGLRPNEPDPTALVELSKTMLAVPEVLLEFLSQYRTADVIAESFRALGIDNLEDYRKTQQEMNVNLVQGVPDQMVEQEVAAGNLVPMGQMGAETS